jgi:hypothetical protein
VTYPTVMIPAFGVPSSILLHFLSLRRLYRPVKPLARDGFGVLVAPPLSGRRVGFQPWHFLQKISNQENSRSA